MLQLQFCFLRLLIRFYFWTKLSLVRFEVFTAVTMKNAVFWDVASCRSCVNRRLEEPRFTQDLHGTTSQKTAFFISFHLYKTCWNFRHFGQFQLCRSLLIVLILWLLSHLLRNIREFYYSHHSQLHMKYQVFLNIFLDVIMKVRTGQFLPVSAQIQYSK
jgi:hypothetical protein